MQTITKTEQRLCRMWATAESTGEFWNLNEKLFEIAVFLTLDHGENETVENLLLCAEIAMARAVYAVKDKERRLAA